MPYEDEEPPLVEPDPQLDQITGGIIGAAIEVHRRLGPGLDESLYSAALAIEFRKRNISFVKELEVEVRYKDELIGTRRIDFLVEQRVVAELKAMEALAPVHSAQVNTYLKLTGLKVGLLINFNTIILKDGLKRIIRP